jgi:hypothetical protein
MTYAKLLFGRGTRVLHRAFRLRRLSSRWPRSRRLKMLREWAARSETSPRSVRRPRSCSSLRNLRQSRRRPERDDHTEPAARIPTAVTMLDHIRGGVGQVVAEKAADGELGLLLIVGNRMSEVAGAVGHRSELPFAELFDRRQVDIDVRIAAIEAERSRAWRDLRPVGDLVKLDAIDDVAVRFQSLPV